MTYNILALDGGGRPLLMIGILEELEARSPGFLESVDLYAGTSAGSVIIAFIAAGDTPQKGLQRAKQFWMSPSNFQVDLLRSVTALTGAHSFSDQGRFIDGLRRAFGSKTLGDLNAKVLMTSIQLDNESPVPQSRRWSMRLFHTLDPLFPDTELNVVDAVVRSGSAPIMSPTYQGYADGGLFANNPSLCALTAARDHFGLSMDTMRIVSIGQGQNQATVDCSQRADYGFQKWLLDPKDPMAILKLVMDSNMQAITYQCSRLLEDQFVRIDPFLTEGSLSGGLNFNRQVLELRQIARSLDYDPVLRQLASIGWSRTPQQTSDPDATTTTQATPRRNRRRTTAA